MMFWRLVIFCILSFEVNFVVLYRHRNSKTRGRPGNKMKIKRPTCHHSRGFKLCKFKKGRIGNPEEWGPDFEGDIKLDASARNGLKNKNTRWKKGIVPYEFDKGFDSKRKEVVLSAMKSIQDLTNGCITFVEKTNEKDYVHILGYLSSCWSYVGKIGGKQEVSLPKWCTDVFGSVQHEFLHALGFFHEQARPTRDSYVTIKWENIDEGNKMNFEKARSENVYAFGEPYDFESVMHYSGWAFSKKRV
ncbi:UNVERIFIED_CONTAM: hypothetical protein RMT77_007962 [Armadillidium vulgare]